MEAITLAALLLAAAAAAWAVAVGRRPRGAAPTSAPAQLHIDQQLRAMTAELSRMRDLVGSVERERAEQYGRLAGQISAAGQRTAELAETTRELRQALSSTKARGQWGERMAEDVLRLAGFVEGVSYRKQTAVEGGRGIPDFTFLLPRNLVLHMDVKFPLDNYLAHLSAETDVEREASQARFLRDVRARVRELSGRGYIDPETTVDCMLLFIPNEQLFAFIQQHDPSILDTALRHRIVLCSPLTLFAVLAVIRQSVDTFALERRADELLALLSGFRRQWDKFAEQMDKVGRSLETASRGFSELQGVRRRQLERPLEHLDALRGGGGVGEGAASEALGAGNDGVDSDAAVA